MIGQIVSYALVGGAVGGAGYAALVVIGNITGGLLMKLIAKSPRLIKFFELDPSDYEDAKKAPAGATAGTENVLNNTFYPSIVSNRLGIRKVETK